MNTIIALLMLTSLTAPVFPLTYYQATQLPQDEKIYDIEEYGIPKPELRKRVDPEFSEMARENRIDGAFVILEAIIDTKGIVKEVNVVRIMPLPYYEQLVQKVGAENDLKALVAASSPSTDDTYDFGKAASDAISKWEFEPSLYNGEAVPIRMLIDVKFFVTL